MARGLKAPIMLETAMQKITTVLWFDDQAEIDHSRSSLGAKGR